MIKEEMDHIYQTLPPEEIPWNVEEPPQIIKQLVSTGKVKPCKAIELGCGIGHYVIYLGSKGFEATGVDISSRAIEMAKTNASQKNAACNFLVADVIGDMTSLEETFDFAYDWQLLHHIFPEDRNKYLNNVCRLLNPGGHYLSVCFSETSPQFGGTGKYRKTPLGTVLYFSSKEEMVSLFSPQFDIEELGLVDIEGKYAPHTAIYAFLKRK